MALGLAVASDIVNAALTFYVRGKALLQSVQDKPLLMALDAKGKKFPGGKDNISSPVQGAFMSDTAGFYQGYSEDDTLAFAQASNLLRASFAWKETHAGLIITHTELKKDGISIIDSMKTSEHSQVDLTRLTGILQNRLDDFTESYTRSRNNMFWRDGTQDSKQVPGVLSLLPDDNLTGSTGGLDRATYIWWRHRVNLNIQASPALQTLTKTLRREVRQLRRYGGKPNVFLCGSLFLDAIEQEVTEKGVYTMEGFAKDIDVTQPGIMMRGVGKLQYDPTLDDLNLSDRGYLFDDRRLTLRPMEGEENKILAPVRPYNYLVFLRSMTWTGGLEITQPNACGVYRASFGPA